MPGREDNEVIELHIWEMLVFDGGQGREEDRHSSPGLFLGLVLFICIACYIISYYFRCVCYINIHLVLYVYSQVMVLPQVKKTIFPQESGLVVQCWNLTCLGD